MHQNNPAVTGPVDQLVRPGSEARRLAEAIDPLRRKAAPDHLTLGCAAQMLEVQAAEIDRLRAALSKANAQAERFERGWYLRGDALETALEDLGQATSFASKKARDRHAKTLKALRTALGPND